MFVLTLIYFLSIQCAWCSYFVLFWNEFFRIEFIFCESGTIVRKFLLVDPYFLGDYIFFLLWMPFKKIYLCPPPFCCLPTPSFFLFLPPGCACCLVSRSKACLGFYLTWEPLCSPQLYSDSRILFYWLLWWGRAGGGEKLRRLCAASVGCPGCLGPSQL